MIDHTRTFLAPNRCLPLRSIVVASILALSLGAAAAQTAFDTPDLDYGGRVRTSGAGQGALYAGGEVKITGQDFKPGQQVTIARGVTPLTPEALVVDPEGKFSASFTLPKDAVIGTHNLVVSTQKPYHAEILDLKISPEVALSGADKFDVASAKLVRGLYQSAYSAKNSALFVTSSAGRPPKGTSELLKVDPQTLAIVAKVTPGTAPGPDGSDDGGVFSVFGVGVDDANDTVWVTNTRQNTVAVYKQSDLSRVKQFEPGVVAHARDVVIDEKDGKAFVSATGSSVIAMFDAKAPAFEKNIEIKSSQRGKDFSVGSLKFDATTDKVYAVSLTTGEAAIISAASGDVEKVFPVEGAITAIGVAYDAASNRLLVAGQGSDNLLIVDAESGKTLHDVKVGAGALNVVFEPVGKLAYVSSRDAGTVTVVDLDGNIVANLENAPLANHVATDGKGNVFAVNKSRGQEESPQGDRLTRIAQKR